MQITSRQFIWFTAITSLVVLGLILLLPRQAYIFRNLAERLTLNQGEHILLLGRPGPGYGGAENTDSIIVLSLRGNQASLVYVPRDLLVPLNGEAYKINSLFLLGFHDELMAEVSRVTGFPVHHYIAYDLQLVRRLIDAMGGIEVNLVSPVTDAVSGFTLGRGRHHVNGDWAEFVIRSRYAPDGDFFRMRSQFAVIRGIREQLAHLSSARVIQLVRVFETSGHDYETDLSPLELLNLFSQLRRVDLGQIEAVILGFGSGLWQDGSFLISLGSSVHGHAYGLVPHGGLGAYGPVQQYIRDELVRRGGNILIEPIRQNRTQITMLATTSIMMSTAVSGVETSAAPSVATAPAAVVDWLLPELSPVNTTTIKR